MPEILEEAALTQNQLLQLIFKRAYFQDPFSIREMSLDIRIGPQLVESLFSYLKEQIRSL